MVFATGVGGRVIGAAGATTTPRVLVCSGTPTVRPHALHWCTSLCSAYVTAITWTTWDERGATGRGTLMTNDGEPNCAQGTWTAHRGHPVTLGRPRVSTYCDGSRASSALLFTRVSLWGTESIPVFRPPCS